MEKFFHNFITTHVVINVTNWDLLSHELSTLHNTIFQLKNIFINIYFFFFLESNFSISLESIIKKFLSDEQRKKH